MSAAATVVSVQGEAFARSPSGAMRRLSNGDTIQQGEVVVTSMGGQVELLTADGQMLSLGAQESFKFGDETTQATAPEAGDAAIQPVVQQPGEINVEQLLEQEAAAAGLGGGGENGGSSFVRLMRIVEPLSPLSYEFDNPAAGDLFPSEGLSSENDLPTAGDLAIFLDEDDISYREGEDVREVAWFDDFLSAVGYPGGYYDNGNNDLADGDDLPQNSPTTMVGTLNFSYGRDGMGNIQFELPSAELTSGGLPIQYWMSADGHTLVGYVQQGFEFPDEGQEERSEVFRISEESYVKVIFSAEVTNVATGGFAFTLYGPLDHPDGSTEDNLTVPFRFTVTDGNGDSVTGTLTVNIDDDSPLVAADSSELPTLTLDESPLPSGSIIEKAQGAGNHGFANAISLDGHFGLGANPDVQNSETQPYVSIHAVGSGAADYYAFTVTQAGSTAVFDVDYGMLQGGSFDPYIHLWDANGNRITYNDDGGLSDSGSIHGWDSHLTYTFSEPGTYYISVGRFPGYSDPNNPIPVGGTYQLQVSLTNAIMGGDGNGDGIWTTSADFSGNFDFAFGADGPAAAGGVDYALSLNGDAMGSGLYALGGDGVRGEEIMLSMEDGNIVGRVGDVAYFSISVDSETGVVSFTRYQNVWHADSDDHDDSASLSALEGTILLTATATDFDGDSASAALDLSSGVFSIEDDGPALNNETIFETVSESNIGTDYSTGTAANEGPAAVSGNLAGLVDFGTDGMNAFAFTSTALQTLYSTEFWGPFPVPVQLRYSIETDGDIATLTAREPDIYPGRPDSSNTVFELELNTRTGEYEFRLHDELRHTGDSDEAIDLNFGALIEAIDNDGDSTLLGDAFAIRVADDVPEPVINLTGAAVQHDETPGNQPQPDNDTSSISVALRFTGIFGMGGVSNTGNDPDVPGSGAIGYARSGTPIVTVSGSEAGADHLASDNLSLRVIDSASGLQTTEGYDITLSIDNQGRIVGRVDDADAGTMNGKAAFAIALADNGEVFVAQYLSLNHPNASDADDVVDLSGKIAVRYSMTDTDGDTRSAEVDVGAMVRFADDGPTLADVAPEARTVQENDIATDFSLGTSPNDGNGDGSYTGSQWNNEPGPAVVAGDLTRLVKFGADGEGSYGFTSDALQKLYSTEFVFGIPVSVRLEYDIKTSSDGLTQTLEAWEPDIYLGRADSGNPVFELELNTQTGAYEFRLHDELRHFGSAEEAIALNFGALIEAVDGDGDAVSLEGAFSINVVDDVPEPVINLTGTSIRHDETPGNQEPNDIGYSSKFVGIWNTGNDPDVAGSGAIGYARSGDALVSTEGSEAGADHLAWDRLSLEVTDSASGLQTTEGYDITLSVDYLGRVVGRVDGGPMDGQAAFAIALDQDGEMFVAQYLSLQHPDGNDHNDVIDLAGKVQVRYSMTDTDGDTRSATVEVGAAIKFADDGPTLTVTTNQAAAGEALATELDETVGKDRGAGNDGNTDDGEGYLGRTTTAIEGGLTTLFEVGGAYGADGPGQTVGSLGFVGIPDTGLATTLAATDGGAITLYLDNGAIVGRDAAGDDVFTIAVVLDNDDNPQLQTTLYEALDHGADKNKFDASIDLLLESGAVQLQYEVTRTDGDGDSTTEAAAIDLIGTEESLFSFDDDGPKARILAVDDASIVLTTQDADTIGSASDTDSANFAQAIRDAVVPDYGSDGEGSVAVSNYRLHIKNSASGLTSQGEEIVLSRITSGAEKGDVVGKAGDEIIFRLSIDGDGTLALTQYAQIDHIEGGDADEVIALADGKLELRATARITDGDGDHVNKTVKVDLGNNIRFDDDNPTIVAPQNLVVNGSFENPELGTGWAPMSSTEGWAATGNQPIEIGHGRNYGITAKDGDQVLELDSHGNASVAQQVDTEGYGAVTLSFWFASRAHGADIAATNQVEVFWNGQSLGVITDATAGRWTQHTFNVAANADGETELKFVGVGTNDSYGGLIDNVSVIGMPTVDEDGLDGSGAQLLYASASLPVNFGADGPGDWTGIALNTDVTSQGDAVGMEAAARGDGAWYGVADGRDVFKVVVDVDAGTYSFTLIDQLDHAEGSDFMKLDFGFTVTDGDGDAISGTVSVGVFDDAPIALDDTDTVVNLSADGNVITGADTTNDGADSGGADESATITKVVGYNGSEDSEFDDDGNLVVEGQFGTLTVKADGSYTYSVDESKLPQPTTVDNPSWNSTNLTAFKLGESFFDANGNYSAGEATGQVSTGGIGGAYFGVTGTSGQNTQVATQINYSGSLSEALAFNFGGPVSAATVGVSNLIYGELYGERESARWHAFDADGVRIGTGVVSRDATGSYANTTEMDGNGHPGTFTVSGIGAFTTLVFEAVPYSGNASSANDNSDYFVKVLSYDALPQEGFDYQDVFTYTLTDADGDSDTATLTIDGFKANPTGNLVNQAPVAVDNDYEVDAGGTASGNIITDDNDGGGARSGRDWDQDTPVLNLSVAAIKVGNTVTQITDNGTSIELEYGTLVINLDGSYTYELTSPASEDRTDSFEYSLRDIHGEPSGYATVTFDIPANATLELPQPIYPPSEPELSFGFGRVTGLSSNTMTLEVAVRDASNTLIFTGTAIFDASANSGAREFTWTDPELHAPLADGASLTATFTAVTGMNAVVHDANLFGEDVGQIRPSNNNPIVIKTFAYSGDTIGSNGADTINGGTDNDTLFGSAGDDTVNGNGGDDILVGGDGNDKLFGDDGNDLLFGGKGNDELTGGIGADTFVWNLGDTGSDTVKDFNLDEGDKLNLADLLQGADENSIGQYLSVSTSGENDANLVLKIDPNGGGGFDTSGYQITLEGLGDLATDNPVVLLNKLQGTTSSD